MFFCAEKKACLDNAIACNKATCKDVWCEKSLACVGFEQCDCVT